MRLEGLRLSALRNFTDIELTPAGGLNIIAGPNASGKTALLESVYLLGRGRSFRTPRIRELIQYGRSGFMITGRLNTDQNRSVAAGIEREQSCTRLRYDGRTVQNLSEHARRVPLVLITPESHGLVNGRPEQRRRWLDWALFHVEPGYLSDWRDCFHALRQRNALLKCSAGASQYDVWEQAFAESAERLDEARRAFVVSLGQFLQPIMAELLPGAPALDYWPGRKRDEALLAILRDKRDQEQERGFTAYGPQRGDIEFFYDGHEARAHLSRGQTKLYIAGIMLAYVEVLKASGVLPVLLIDDLPAELDRAARQRFMALLLAGGMQTFVTAIEPDVLGSAVRAARLFHVEQGRLVSVV